MRIGVNPEKFKGEKNIKKQHRVVVVFYVPNIEEDYYKESIAVLDACLNSLVNTINFETTNITLINNNSVVEVTEVIEKYIRKKQIDKYVLYDENKGKVYAVIDEVRGIYEPFVTITDCDVLFFSGWEQAVFDVFKNYSKAGVVTPLPSPYSAFTSNISVFFDHYFLGKMRYNKIVKDKDVDLYIHGVNNEALIKRKGRYNWKEKQYYLNGKVKAIVGATHFVATYKSEIFRQETAFPEIKFVNGYETAFIDDLAEKKGLYRLSTINTYAYHIGNKMDDFAERLVFNSALLLNQDTFTKFKKSDKRKINFVPFVIKKMVFNVVNKLNRF
jgi:hypothetical protein